MPPGLGQGRSLLAGQHSWGCPAEAELLQEPGWQGLVPVTAGDLGHSPLLQLVQSV